MYINSTIHVQMGDEKNDLRFLIIGFEIAMLGRTGIDTDKPGKTYSLNTIPGKKFTGRHLLAYMYAAFQVIDPNVDVGLDFEEEYEQAKKLAE